MRLLILLFVTCFSLLAQAGTHNPDKVYLHLDRNLYAQGDTIWIKGYAMERGTNKPSDKSYAIHVQMLNEEGKQVETYKFLTIDGVATGQIELLGVAKPGFYQLVAHTGYMKNFDQRFFFKTTFEVREKVRRRTINALFDQVAYTAGDTAEVTFSVIDQNKTPVGGARFIYQYMQGDEVVKRKGVRCADDGIMTVRIPIEQSTSNDKPILQLSYYADDLDVNRKEQEIAIPIKNNKINISFFPEGGDLIQGISRKVAFKAFDDKGNPVNIKGNLYKNDELLSPVSTLHDGMGMFSLQPDQSSFTFKITEPTGIDSIYSLPDVKEQGFALAYLSQNQSQVYLSVKQNYATPQDCKLWISYCDSLWSVHDCEVSGECQLPISKKILPNGIVTFTLSDVNGVPQAERLVYVQKEKPILSIGLNNEVFKPKQKVDLTLNINTTHPVNLSFSVVDSLLSNSPQLNIGNIKAYAELESELQGYISKPNQYLGNNRNIANKRDLLLMTHGWRRFEWIDNRESLSKMDVHDFNRVYGQVTRLGKPYPKAKIGAYMLGETIAFTDFKADENGRFYLDPEYRTQAYKDMLITVKKGRTGASLKIQNTDTLLFNSIINKHSGNIEKSIYQTIRFKEQEINELNDSFMLYDTQQLKEFEVSAQSKEWDMSRYFQETTEAKLGEEIEEFISFDWLLSQVSNKLLGYQERYSGPLIDYYKELRTKELQTGSDEEDIDTSYRGYIIYVSSGCTIVRTSSSDRKDLILEEANGIYTSFLVNELSIMFNDANPPSAMIYVNDKPWGYNTSSLDLLVKSDINAVAVLDGAQGYERFGTEAYYGAIMVYIKPEALAKIQMKSYSAIFGNFVKARQFAKPIYETEEQIKTAGDDNRITLHWEPLLETDENGKAEVSFYTGDIPGKKQIIVQGFDEDGNLYYQTGSFVVKDVLENR